MRILAIRGQNLASLAGDFELDLAAAPLGGAGVFAIVGNTGAGKSTLLDALCVALFDRTPRLTNHSRVQVGRGDNEAALLGAQDVRTLLRRGAAAGYAEVDFESGDSRRYRARWSVRRARNQSDGTLQAQQISFVALDGSGGRVEALGGTKTETLDAIRGRLGLSFDQFRRSALLAQGEFAAFLRADGKDRSELLERMTGTEIYTRLSIAAHAKAAAAETRFKDLRGRADAIAILSDEALAEAGTQHALALDAQGAARARFAAAEAALRWSREATLRATALDDAATAVTTAQARVAEAVPLRAELEHRRRVEALRPLWDTAARAALAHTRAIADRSTAVSTHAAAVTAHADLHTVATALAHAHAPLVAARAAARIPTTLDAASTDARLRPRGRAEAAAGGHAAERGRIERVIERAQEAEPAARWLTERAGVVEEIVRWPELEACHEQRGALGTAIREAERALVARGEAARKLGKERDRAHEELQQSTQQLADAQRKLAAFQSRRTVPIDIARRDEDRALVRVKEMDALGAIVTRARDAAVVIASQTSELATLADAGRTEAGRSLVIVTDTATATTLRDERARSAAQIRLAAGFDHQRAELRDGEDCPLCGATEHPWHGRGALDSLVAAAEHALAEVTSTLQALAAERAQLAAHAKLRTRDQARAEAALAAATAALALATTQWRDDLAALGELQLEADPSSPNAARIATELATASRAAHDAARTAFRQAEAATKAASEAQGGVDLAQVNVNGRLAALATIDTRRAELLAEIERARTDLGHRQTRHAELTTTFLTGLDRWQLALARPAVDGPTTAATAATAATAVVSGRTGAGKSSPSGAVTAALVVDETTFASRRAEIATLVREWGRAVEIVGAVEPLVAAAITTIDTEVRAADRAVTEGATRVAECERRVDEHARDHAAAHAALESAANGAGFGATAADRRNPDGSKTATDVDGAAEARSGSARGSNVAAPSTDSTSELDALLAASPARIEALAEQIAELERAVAQAGVLVEERRARAAEHAAGRGAHAESLARGDAEPAQVAELAAAVTAAETATGRIATTLAADTDARERRTRAFAELEHAEAGSTVDRVLGSVIGSHDGKLFRSFAQSLTLDGLLAVANAHLEELAPRYQLERVPRHDLELQVSDRDLGSEVRSVQSLSGGESFLVSLALALGLSSMSAQDVRVRTLLIDEGFGTLDPATLDGALAVLDRLQSTGRQVGVISHVPALVERVGAHVRVIQRGGGRSEVVVA